MRRSAYGNGLDFWPGTDAPGGSAHGTMPRLRIRTGRVGRFAFVCGLLMIAGPLAATLLEKVGARQPGNEVLVRQLSAGTLLVAARNLPDPNFANTVVLLVDHSRDGAAGLVLNRPSRVPLSRLRPGAEPFASIASPAFIGGPVSPETVLALSRAACDGCREVDRDVHLVNAPAALQALIAGGADEHRLRVYVGYAGWGRGQLESEVRRGGWRVVAGTAPVVFDPDPSSLWRRMIERTEAVLASLHHGGRHAGLPRAGAGTRLPLG
jgi:putative transcriptional regulator